MISAFDQWAIMSKNKKYGANPVIGSGSGGSMVQPGFPSSWTMAAAVSSFGGTTGAFDSGGFKGTKDTHVYSLDEGISYFNTFGQVPNGGFGIPGIQGSGNPTFYQKYAQQAPASGVAFQPSIQSAPSPTGALTLGRSGPEKLSQERMIDKSAYAPVQYSGGLT